MKQLDLNLLTLTISDSCLTPWGAILAFPRLYLALVATVFVCSAQFPNGRRIFEHLLSLFHVVLAGGTRPQHSGHSDLFKVKQVNSKILTSFFLLPIAEDQNALKLNTFK